jgi:N-methylhydantoinase B
MTPIDAREAIGNEVFANLFRGIVDEMAGVVLRSSHTTFVKETQDFSTGLITPEGEMFATPTTSGASSNACTSMRAGTQAVDDWRPGDVLMTNDPYTTEGMVMHLNDIFLFKPVFAEGRLLCFTWAFIHCTDVGGYAPGSVDMRNRELFQEGVRIRPVKLYEEGRLQERVWDFLADNSRIPALNWGDIAALKAAMDRAEDRLGRLCERHAVERVRAAMYSTLDRSEQVARRVLARIPACSHRFVEYFEDDYVSDLPIRLELELRSTGDGEVTLDFTGSDPQVASALNLPSGGQPHHPFLCLGLIHYVVTNAEGLHFNAGVVRPIELVLPEASVVNSSFPAACGMRYSTAIRVHDLVLGALLQALPEEVPVSGSGQVVVTYISTSELGDSGRVVVINPVQGGSGGSAALDGVDAVNYGSAFLRNVPVEVVESEAPVLVRRFGLRPDSEGAGRRRGGVGVNSRCAIRARWSSCAAPIAIGSAPGVPSAAARARPGRTWPASPGDRRSTSASRRCTERRGTRPSRSPSAGAAGSATRSSARSRRSWPTSRTG